MAKYIISNVSIATSKSTQKQYKKFSVQPEGGTVVTQGVVAFPSVGIYNLIEDGATVKAELVEKNDPKYGLSYSLKDEAGMGGSYGGTKNSFSRNGEAILAATERKEKSIQSTLDRKEDSFMISGTARDATLILTALIAKATTVIDWKTEWLKIRAWLVNNYHNVDSAGLTSAGTKVPDFSEVDVSADAVKPGGQDIPF